MLFNGISFDEVVPVKEDPIFATMITKKNIDALRTAYGNYDLDGEIELGNWLIVELWDLGETSYYTLTPEEFSEEFIFIETGEED